MTKRSTITIPAPIATWGDCVEVKNYRKKTEEVWEKGQCLQVDWSVRDHNDNAGGKSGGWSYRVRLDRRSPNGHIIILHISDDGIRKV